MIAAASFLCGLIFGSGLLLSGMTQPAKVLGFLDILGQWDPTLAFVMTGALATTAVGYAFVRRSGRPPLVAARHLWPQRSDIDRPLVVGSALFGIGWGLVGLCPGPAIENLATLSPSVMLFVVAMVAGMIMQDWLQSRRPSTEALEEAAAARSDG